MATTVAPFIGTYEEHYGINPNSRIVSDQEREKVQWEREYALAYIELEEWLKSVSTSPSATPSPESSPKS